MKGMTYERFKELFDDLNDAEKIQLWNDLCDDYDYEERLYNMDDLDDFLGEMKPSELLTMVDDDFSYNDDYFYFDGGGRLCSVRYLEIFFETGRGDIEEIYDWLGRIGELKAFAEENDPDYNEEDWYDEEECYDEDEE